MRNHVSRAITLLTILGLGACSRPTPEQQFADDLIGALGGRDRVQAVRTLTIEGTGLNYNLGQDVRPDAATQTFEITGYRRRIDLVNGRQQIEQTRTPRFAYFQGQQPQKQVQGLDGEIAFNVSASGDATRLASRAELDRRTDLYHHPLLLARALTDAKATVNSVTTDGTSRKAELTTAAGPTVTLTLDAAGVPQSVSSTTDHPNLGDVVMLTTFGSYEDVGGLRLPGRFAGKVDDFTTWELEVTGQALDADAGDLAAPKNAAGNPPAAPPANVAVEPIAKGVWLLGGQSHHSVLVEFADRLLLIDAPQSEARTLAVIAKAKETVPGKPLRQLVTTHHHFDHTAGLRAAIAEGMTVITQEGNREWVERMAARPHTIQPDSLARMPGRAVVETVGDALEIKDATMTLMLYHVAGNPHSETMLMAYLPRDRVLIEVDAFTPGSQVQPYAANLVENVDRRKLRVDRVVPLHGTGVPAAEMRKAVPQT